MRGHFDVAVKDAGGLKDEDFLAAKAAGNLRELVDKLSVVQRAACNNQLMTWLSSMIISRVVGHSFPNAPWPVYSGYILPWHHVCLLTTDSEPVYNYAWTVYCNQWDVTDSVGSTASKNFINSVAETTVIAKTTGGKEELYFKSRWLYLPSQGNSNNIRSLGIYGSEYYNSGSGEDRWMTGRVRLKDPITGLPVILIKNFNQVLVIEYTVFFVTI